MFVRMLLIWLLVLAVPAQGAAAATMAFCGPGHHDGQTAAHGHSEPAAGHSDHGRDASSAQMHHQAMAQADEDRSATPAKFVQADKQKCSVCASCCSAAAILTTVLDLPVPPLGKTAFIALVPTIDVFIPDGPERPPRALLA